MTEANRTPADDIIYLIGRPAVSGFIRYVRTRTLRGPLSDDAELAFEWRRARDVIRELELSEKGVADEPSFRPLPEAMLSVASAAIQDTVALRSLRYVRHQWHMVEIDRLVVFQKVVNLRIVREIKETLSQSPNAEQIIRLATGTLSVSPPVQVAQPAENTYTFTSTTDDVRFLDVVPLDPALLSGYQPSGHAVNMMVVFVGFGRNILSAFQVGNRLVLINGSHRAYALRELGITHVPCLVSHVSGQEELDLVAPADIKQNTDAFLRAPRPPLFKDYFDERLHKRLQIPKFNQMLQVQLNFQRMNVPAL